MSTFQLTIVTPDGEYYHGPAESLTVRATTGELTLLAHHTNFVTTVGMGPAKVVLDGNARTAACIGGMLSVINGEVRLIATTFEWAEDIDRERAKSALERAEAKLADASLSKAGLKYVKNPDSDFPGSGFCTRKRMLPRAKASPRTKLPGAMLMFNGLNGIQKR